MMARLRGGAGERPPAGRSGLVRTALRACAAPPPAWILAGAILVTGCRTIRREAWIEDGVTRGVLEKRKTQSGFDYRYLDAKGRLVRQEFRDPEENLVPGPCTCTFEHDASGKVVEIAFRDSEGRPARNLEGYAIARLLYSEDAAGRQVVEVTHYDESDFPATVRDGYARVRRTYAKGTTREEQTDFLDLSGRPVRVRFLNREGVARVQYANVEGIGVVSFAVLFGLDGKVIDRVRLSGTTEGTWGHTY